MAFADRARAHLPAAHACHLRTLVLPHHLVAAYTRAPAAVLVATVHAHRAALLVHAHAACTAARVGSVRAYNLSCAAHAARTAFTAFAATTAVLTPAHNTHAHAPHTTTYLPPLLAGSPRPTPLGSAAAHMPGYAPFTAFPTTFFGFCLLHTPHAPALPLPAYPAHAGGFRKRATAHRGYAAWLRCRFFTAHHARMHTLPAPHRALLAPRALVAAKLPLVLRFRLRFVWVAARARRVRGGQRNRAFRYMLNACWRARARRA